MMKEEWLFPGAIVPVDVETTAALVAEIRRLIDVVGGMKLAQLVRLADLHLYEEIAEHYAKCAISPEALRDWVAERANTLPQPVQEPTLQEQLAAAEADRDKAREDWDKAEADWSKAIAEVARIEELIEEQENI